MNLKKRELCTSLRADSAKPANEHNHTTQRVHQNGCRSEEEIQNSKPVLARSGYASHSRHSH